MKPLSSFKYVIRNKKKVQSLVLSICIGVFLVCFPTMIINQCTYLSKDTYEKPLSIYSFVMKNNSPISDATINNVKNNENTERILPAGRGSLDLPILIGKTSSDLIHLRSVDISYFTNKLNLKLVEGKLPDNNTLTAIVIHKKVALSNGIKLNDILFGNVPVVAIIDGPSVINFISIPRLYSDEANVLRNEGMMVISKEGKIKELNNFLETMPIDELTIYNINTAAQNDKKSSSILNLVSYVLEILVIIVLSITLGNINYINMYHRKRELGVLLAMGYTKKQLYIKLIKEAIICCLLGYFAGICLTISTGWILNAAVWSAQGKELPLWDPPTLLLTLFIPVFVIIFSIIPAVKALKNTDCIEIIEGTTL